MSVPRMRGRVGSVVGNKWRIERPVAMGGMANVYAATNITTGFRVAMKILSEAAGRHAEAKRRFVREGYLANGVKHPGVVNVIDDGVTDDGALYLIMELLEGQTLEDRREAAGKVPVDEALDLVLSVSEILAAAHDAGVVHRDVKPSNIFLTSAGTVKLLDFGVAGKRQVDDNDTRTGAGAGTLMYMAPEQATGDQRIDARADVHALGVTLYRIVSGKFPFETTVAGPLIAGPKPLHELEPGVPAAVSAVVARATAAVPEARYVDARAFAVALKKALGHSTEIDVPASSPLEEDALTEPDSRRQPTSFEVDPPSLRTVVMTTAPHRPSTGTMVPPTPRGHGPPTAPFTPSRPFAPVVPPPHESDRHGRGGPARGAGRPTNGVDYSVIVGAVVAVLTVLITVGAYILSR